MQKEVTASGGLGFRHVVCKLFKLGGGKMSHRTWTLDPTLVMFKELRGLGFRVMYNPCISLIIVLFLSSVLTSSSSAS